jgi:uncharacterized membrane protein
MAGIDEKIKSAINDTKDTSNEYTEEDKTKNKTMAILSYIIPLIPYFVEKESKWVNYHAAQGMNLLIVSIVVNVAIRILYAILGWTLWGVISLISTVCSLSILVLAILGIMNVCNGRAKELPIVNKVKIFK